eukprot:CAMPEP_0185030236 /NCGR_PEP_ID=MMETSP1103-20130426/17058_1 /TAXON_ID=36769 /ORGANISM="Paraphysomonas bandaiensis, Strain Caron Lab Isolate" /LENGTH=696 /DNA_ID=CAMNT_0027565273 /DNA_START=81 /DNA_END=2171 /DNA_ORIENTATION=-
MADGSVISTHNNDCQECDIRITHVPARDWPNGSKRPIFRERTPYPRFLQTEEYNIHGPEYLVGTEDSSIYPWQAQDPIFFIDQVKHTYAYTMGSYPLQNEKQLSFGESTCTTSMWSTPSWLGGKANFNVRSLMEVALERCETARCAIKLMGQLAEDHGFYCVEGPATERADCSEALTVSDPREVWIFHINADDTHESAVWVAQRVPDDHISALANQFVITEIDVEDTENYLASKNVFEVAIRANLWDPSKGPFNYLKAYGIDEGAMGHGITRRVWRVFTMADPSLPLSPFTDAYGSYGFGKDGNKPYPFSIKPHKPLHLQDIMAMTRDNYDGTPFDMTEGPEAGPFGDVIRSAPNSKLVNEDGLDWPEYKTLAFPNRAISIWRTAYSAITQSRANLPDEVGAVTWIAPYAPHHSTFVPVYASAPTAPSSLTNTTQHKLDRSKNYWAHCVVGNYLSRWYKWTIGDVQSFQKQMEEKIFSAQSKIEASAVKAISKDNVDDAIGRLSDFQEDISGDMVAEWWDFFWAMTAKYRDIYKVTRPNSESFLNAPDFIGYERWWSEMVGFWGAPGKASPMRKSPVGIPPMVFDAQKTQDDFDKKYPAGAETKYFLHPDFSADEPSPAVAPSRIPDGDDDGSEPIRNEGDDFVRPPARDYSDTATLFGTGGFLLGFALATVGFCIWKKYTDKQGYATIPDSNFNL